MAILNAEDRWPILKVFDRRPVGRAVRYRGR
jgi:hypothetical protein